MESSVTLSYSKTPDGSEPIGEVTQNDEFYIHARLETEEELTKPFKLTITVTIPQGLLIPDFETTPKLVKKEMKFVKSDDKYTATTKITKKDWINP